MAELKTLAPLHLLNEVGKKAHNFPLDLDILNEVPCFVIVYDFLELGKPRKVWASRAWLDYVQQSLQEFQEYDFAANVSAPIKRVLHDMGQQVQLERAVSNLDITMYPVDKPLSALAMHQPLLVDSREHALLLCCHFNSQSVVADKSAIAKPLDFNFRENVCAKIHKFPESLEVLDELPMLSVLYDFAGLGQPRLLWGSLAWLRHVGHTLDTFTSAPFEQTAPTLLQAQSKLLWQEVQVNRRAISFETCIDCAEPQLRAQAVLRPILFAGMPSPMALCVFTPPNEEPDMEKAKRSGDGRFERQVVHWLDEGAGIFEYTEGPDWGQALWANHRLRIEYGVVFDMQVHQTLDGQHFHLDRVLESCVWSSASDKAALREMISSLRFGSDPVVITCQKRRASVTTNHSSVWHRLSFQRCKNPYTGAECLLLLESDVSSLLRAQRELQASNDLKDQFLQCMSHELRTPLNGIMGLTSVMLNSPHCPPQLEAPLATIDSSAKHLNALVSDILETAECMAGSFQLRCDLVNLVEIAERACDVVRPRLQAGVALRNALPNDGTCLIQVLSHLIGNAVKFTAKGSITVRAEQDSSGQMRVEVADTGRGIPEPELPLIWDHFRQGDMSTTREHGGTGLGLALVRLLVKAHGGDVGVASRLGQGSTFSFTLPREGPSVEEKAGSSCEKAWRPLNTEKEREESSSRVAEQGGARETRPQEEEREAEGSARGREAEGGEEREEKEAAERDERRESVEAARERGDERERVRELQAEVRAVRRKASELEAAQRRLQAERDALRGRLEEEEGRVRQLQRRVAALQGETKGERSPRRSGGTAEAQGGGRGVEGVGVEGAQRSLMQNGEEEREGGGGARDAGTRMEGGVERPRMPAGGREALRREGRRCGKGEEREGVAQAGGACAFCQRAEEQLARAMRLLQRVRGARAYRHWEAEAERAEGAGEAGDGGEASRARSDGEGERRLWERRLWETLWEPGGDRCHGRRGANGGGGAGAAGAREGPGKEGVGRRLGRGSVLAEHAGWGSSGGASGLR